LGVTVKISMVKAFLIAGDLTGGKS